MDQSVSILFFFAAILVFAGVLFAIITLTKKGPRQLNAEKYRSKWLAIEQQLVRDNVGSYSLSVLEADKLLDQAMKERGITGETMGARMKQLQKVWSNANAVWGAHKLRNQIAHESDAKVTYENARRALASFKQALKDIGAI